ncbi:hypothetical protein PFICI_12748 [Pestalotiopsis fici W106-1]|uniref:6-phosphogluconate dehydrogenase NADP-binding domain-containing protein n=1 Tax=Pestalotiopsis fici (strain W106-1 / CGMCC3.15140) TaxID=1229662 RepID=W3WPT9_PESFW|nr:uncharacterized protein PFICI_12748 [Pestalotiopsis fici W106-1]ETS75804.1 hypothetical protein PFICI_12748 [Pestalotiopsis fici W106-1]
MRVGFLGLGVMGTPMALNLSRRFPLSVWNRSPAKYAVLRQAGANIAESPIEVLEQSDVIFTMLFNERAFDTIMDKPFYKALAGKTLINTSSVSADFSQRLAAEVSQAGGDFVEMPVSGSRVPAEQGTLVGMMAGDEAVAQRIQSVVEPITSAAIYCGPVGMGLKTKYAVNLFLITMTAGLAEAMNLAQAQGLNLDAFAQVIQAGPMASAYSGLKIQKMLNQDWSAQAAIKDCYNSTQLIQTAAAGSGVNSPLIQLCGTLYKQAIESGLGEEDMISVMKVIGALNAEKANS